MKEQTTLEYLNSLITGNLKEGPVPFISANCTSDKVSEYSMVAHSAVSDANNIDYKFITAPVVSMDDKFTQNVYLEIQYILDGKVDNNYDSSVIINIEQAEKLVDILTAAIRTAKGNELRDVQINTIIDNLKKEVLDPAVSSEVKFSFSDLDKDPESLNFGTVDISINFILDKKDGLRQRQGEFKITSPFLLTGNKEIENFIASFNTSSDSNNKIFYDEKKLITINNEILSLRKQVEL